MSRLILQRQNAVILQQVMFTVMPGKQEFVSLPLGASIYSQACFAKPGKIFKKRAWALLGNNLLIVKTTWNKSIQCPGSVLLLNRVNISTESITIAFDRATRFREIYVNNSWPINKCNGEQNKACAHAHNLSLLHFLWGLFQILFQEMLMRKIKICWAIGKALLQTLWNHFVPVVSL